jgi:ferrous iron transport protein B
MSEVAAPAPARTVPSCHEAGGAHAPAGSRVVALVGAPNVGKSTLFNALTGARRTMGNWPGTTVEVGRGAWRAAGGDEVYELLDLPGAYSLDPQSPDEALTRALVVDIAPEARPDVVVVIAAATHLARSLYIVSQMREYPLRVIVALTMSDVAERRGVHVDPSELSRATPATAAGSTGSPARCGTRWDTTSRPRVSTPTPGTTSSGPTSASRGSTRPCTVP